MPATLLLAAGLNNIFERVKYGAVIDPMRIADWYGNGADIAIGIGIFFLIWGIMHSKNIL